MQPFNTIYHDRLLPLVRRVRRSPALLGGTALVVAVVGGLVITIALRSAPPVQVTTQAPPAGNPLADLQQASRSADVWTSEAQRRRQWELGKMTALGRMVAALDDVQQATVLLDSARPGGLGRKATPASASVQVTLQDGATMTDDLLAAIGDLVVGGVGGLDRSRISIIDQTGREYSLSEDDHRQRQALASRQRWQNYYADQLRDALRYIPGLVVAVRVEPADQHQWTCSSVSLSVPRAVFQDIFRRSEADQSGPPAAVFDAIVRDESDRIREYAAQLLDLPPSAVQVRSHYQPLSSRNDTPASGGGPPSRAEGGFWEGLWFATLGLIELALLGTIVARRVGRRRRRLAWARVRAVARRQRLAGVDETTSEPEQPFDAIKQATIDDLVTLLNGESDQAAALVLAHLSPARAARVLAGMSGDRQSEITRRIAELDQIAPSLIRQVERQLAERLGRLSTPPTHRDGVSTVTRILQHTGQAGRRTVLQALQQQDPRLAESISRQLLGFEDILQMEPARLAEALDEVDIQPLALAMWTLDDTQRERIASSLPSARAQQIETCLAELGPVRLSQVESAQRQVVDIVKDYETTRGRHVPGEELLA